MQWAHPSGKRSVVFDGGLVERLSGGTSGGDLQSKENQKNKFPVDLDSSFSVYSSPFKMEMKITSFFFRFPVSFLTNAFLLLFITKY